MKKIYENPTIQVACISAEDVRTTLIWASQGMGEGLDWENPDTTSERNVNI